MVNLANRRFVSCILGVCLSLFNIPMIASCDHGDPNDLQHTETKHKSFEDFMGGIEKFPYVASAARKTKIMTSYEQLSIGAVKQEVYGLLGEPDVEIKVYSKSKEPGFLGWMWTYYLFKIDSLGDNRKQDQGIKIFFDENGKTSWIAPFNIEGLVEKGNSSLFNK